MGTFYTANFAFLRGLCSGQYLWVHRATHPHDLWGLHVETVHTHTHFWVHMAKHLTCGNTHTYIHTLFILEAESYIQIKT